MERDQYVTISPQREPADFWDLHRRLGECYQADLASTVISRPHGSSRSGTIRRESFEPQSPRTVRKESFESMRGRLPTGGQTLSGNVLKGTAESNSGVKSISRSVEAALVNLRGHADAMPAIPPKRAPSPLGSSRRTLSNESSDTVQKENPRQSHDLEDLQPRKEWLPVEDKTVTKLMHKAASMLSLSQTQSTVENAEPLEISPPRCIIHPSGTARTIWNVLTVIALVWDIIVIPMEFFELPNSALLSVLTWATVFFWSVDMLFSFATGIYRKGVLVMEPKVIALAYVRSWFPLDVLLVTFDWLSLATISASVPDHEMEEDAYRAVWALRLLRLCRIIRLGKIGRTALNLKEVMHSWAMSVQYSIFMNVFMMMLMLHVVACGWWAFGHLWGNSDGWSVQFEIEGVSLLYSYTTSLHWAISQLGVSSTQIEATNSTERIFSIGVAILSLITFSTMVSSMTSMMGTWYAEKEEERKQFSSLQRYLKYYTISPGLSQRITHFLQHAASQRKATVSDLHVPLLELLSKPLRGELQLEKFSSSMKQNAFLGALLNCDNVTVLDVMKRLATNAISTITLGGKDVIFRYGMEAVASYLTAEGSLTYLQENKMEVHCEGWASEMCLWTDWFYVGDLVAETVSKVFVLDVEAFCDVVASSHFTQKLAVAYASEYVQSLHQEEQWSDLWSLDKQPEVQDFFRGRQEPQLIFNTFARAGTPGVSGSGRFARGVNSGFSRGGRLTTFTRGIVPISLD